MKTQALFGHVSTLGCLSVRTKTFSTHVEPQKCDDVRKSGLFTHAKTSLRNVAMPETGSDILQGETALTVMVTHAVETLVRRRGVQRAAVGAIWTDLDIIEEGEDVVLDVFPAGIYGQGHGRISGADVGSDGHQRRSVVSLAEKQEAVHAEIVSQKLVNDSGRQFHAYILAEKRGVTALT